MVPTNLPYLHLPTYLPIFLPYQPYPPYLPYHLTYPPPTYRAAPRRRRAPLAAGHARGHRVVPWLSPPGSWPGTCEAMAWLRANLLRPRAWGANQGTVERHATACSWCFHLPAAVELLVVVSILLLLRPWPPSMQPVDIRVRVKPAKVRPTPYAYYPTRCDSS